MFKVLKDGGLMNTETGKTISKKEGYEVADGFEVETTWAKMYSEMLMEDRIKLTGAEQSVLWFAISKMNEKNEFFLSSKKQKSIARLEIPYAHKTIEKALGSLRQKEVIISMYTKGKYMVNQKYFGKYREKEILMMKVSMMKLERGENEKQKFALIKEYGLKEKEQA